MSGTMLEEAEARLSYREREEIDREAGSGSHEVIRKRLDRLQVLRAKGGGSLDRLTGQDAAEAEKLVDQVKYAENRIPVRPMLHPGGSWSAAAAPMPGWRKGHWGGPAVRQVDAKAIAPSGGLTVPSLTAGIVGLGDRPLSVLGAVPSEALTATDSFAFLQETKREHKAAEVAAGALKPTSVYQVEKVEGKVSVVAHLSEPIDRSLLSDAVQLSEYLDGSLRQGVLLAVDDAIVNGDGEGVKIRGILSTEGITVIEYLEAGLLATTRRAVRTLEEDNPAGSPGSWVVSPEDWESLELLTLEGSGVPALGAQIPVDRAQQRLWGRPVTISTVLPEKTALLCDFQGSTRVYEREAVTVTWSESVTASVEGHTGFEVNQVKWRAECRVGFACLRPAAMLKVETA